MKNLIVLISALTILASCSTGPARDVVEEKIKISDIAFKAEQDVSVVLGPSEQMEETENGPKHFYKEGRFEVVYINNKADWIKINDDWEDIDLSEIRSYVSVHTYDDHAYIKASTP